MAASELAKRDKQRRITQSFSPFTLFQTFDKGNTFTNEVQAFILLKLLYTLTSGITKMFLNKLFKVIFILFFKIVVSSSCLCVRFLSSFVSFSLFLSVTVLTLSKKFWQSFPCNWGFKNFTGSKINEKKASSNQSIETILILDSGSLWDETPTLSTFTGLLTVCAQATEFPRRKVGAGGDGEQVPGFPNANLSPFDVLFNPSLLLIWFPKLFSEK